MYVSGIASGFDGVLGKAFSGQLRNVGNVFTPRRVVRFALDMVGVGPDDRIFDPACGTGGFLVWAWRKLIENLNADADLSEAERRAAAQMFADNLYACDERQEAVDLAKANLMLHGVQPSRSFRSSVRRHDGLYPGVLRTGIDDGRFDGAQEGQFTIVACNPPFGRGGNAVTDHRILRLFETARGASAMPLEYLFIERAIRLLTAAGRLAIVVPEGFLSASRGGAGEARDYLLEHVHVVAIAQIPRDVWRATNSRHETNASVLIGIRKRVRYEQQTPVLLATATTVDPIDPLATDDLEAIRAAVRVGLQAP